MAKERGCESRYEYNPDCVDCLRERKERRRRRAAAKKRRSRLGSAAKNRAELLGIIKDAVSFVNRAARPLGGNDIHQCRYMNRRLRMARLLLDVPKRRLSPARETDR